MTSLVCMIYSHSTLPEMEEVFQYRYGAVPGRDYSSLRVIRVKNKDGQWTLTNRTVGIFSETFYKELINDGLDQTFKISHRDFRIVPYEVKESTLPKSSNNLFIRIPFTLNLTASEITEIINTKLRTMVDHNLITHDYTVKIPNKSKNRTTPFIQGSVFIVFNDRITPIQAALIKVLIDDTLWVSDRPDRFTCFWSRGY